MIAQPSNLSRSLWTEMISRCVQWSSTAWGRVDHGGEECHETAQPADTPSTGRGTDSALLRTCARWLHAPPQRRNLLQQNRGRDTAAIDKLKDESEGPNEPCPPQELPRVATAQEARKNHCHLESVSKIQVMLGKIWGGRSASCGLPEKQWPYPFYQYGILGEKMKQQKQSLG